MTRDEAIRIYGDAVSGSGTHFLDGLVALGLLTLEEPNQSDIKSKIREMATNYAPQASIFDWMDRLDIDGLKIVEK